MTTVTHLPFPSNPADGVRARLAELLGGGTPPLQGAAA
jgi:hypothetical protein